MPVGFDRYGRGYGSSDPASLRDALEEARDQLSRQNEMLQRIAAGPTARGYVVSIYESGSISKALLSVSQQLVEVQVPPEHSKTITTGCCVRVQVDSLAILDVIPSDNLTGDIATVRTDGKGGECEVDWHGNVRVVRYGFDKTPEAGDRVMVDATCHVCIRNFGPDTTKFSFQGDTGVSWNNIGGLKQAKETLKEAFELPFQHPDLYRAYGKKQVKGVMLYGPSGTGKTLLAKAVATSIRGTHGAHPSGFLYCRGPELLDKFVGQTEAQIRSLFARGRDHFKKHGYPSVLFIDEADAILGKRGARLNMGTETTVVPQFLSEMDGLTESGCVVLLATNRSDTLDPAVTRDGRIDRKIHVTRPDRNSTEEIFRLHLRNKPITSNQSVEIVAQKAADFIFDSKHILYEIMFKDKSKKSFLLSQLVNGAMIAGMVDTASTIAMIRDIKSGSVGGISLDDFRIAADQLFVQNLHTNHDTELEEMVETLDQKPVSIERPKITKNLLLL